MGERLEVSEGLGKVTRVAAAERETPVHSSGGQSEAALGQSEAALIRLRRTESQVRVVQRMIHEWL